MWLCRGRVSSVILLQSLFGVMNKSALNGFLDGFHEKIIIQTKRQTWRNSAHETLYHLPDIG